MKLFILIGRVFYEETEILGIYSSIELAEQNKKIVESHHHYFDDISIDETELNKDIE